VTKSLKTLPRLSPINQQPKTDLLLPKFGVSWLGWSSCGQYLAAREESYPRCLWIWHGLEARLCDLLVQLDSIVCARWMPRTREDQEEADPIGPVLAFCCNTPRVYFWTLQGSSWADLPQIVAPTTLSDAPPKPPSHRSSSSSTRSVKPPSLAASDDSDRAGGVDLSVSSLKWSPGGKQLILIGRDRFCACDVSFASHEVQVQKSDDQSAW
jgi:hypothetical protein